MGTLDGYLVALDAASGEVSWRIDTLIDRDQYYSITGAPRVVKGKVIIDNDGAEYDVRGYISAFDSATGELAWRFFTVPGNAEGPFEHEELAMAVSTWDPDSNWKGAGGTAWDYTATQHMILADIQIGGQQRKVLMQAPMSYSRNTGLVYIPSRDIGWVFNQAGDKWFTLGVDNVEELSAGQDIPDPSGYLKAWDPVAQKLAWQMKLPNVWNGGALSTAGGLGVPPITIQASLSHVEN